MDEPFNLCSCYRSTDFRQSFARIHELRAFVRPGTPMLAATATVTKEMRLDVMEKLDMKGCEYISASPNKPNIMYRVFEGTSIEDDLAFLVEDLRDNNIKAERVIVYCRSLNMCSSLYAHFLYELKENSYHPPGADQKSDNRLFGMFHSNTTNHNKAVILKSMVKFDGTVRVVFATMALGMGVNFVGFNTNIHYGAPRCIDDYFQESGRAGRSGEKSTSTIYWTPTDAPVRKDLSNPQDAEVAVIRRYLENVSDCRRFILLSYFDNVHAKTLTRRDPLTCCDNCKATYINEIV